MATSAILSSQTVAELPLKTEVLNYALIAEGDPAKPADLKFSLTTSTKTIESIESPEYKGDKTVVCKPTVSKPIVGTMAGFDELFPSDKDKLFIINKGIDAHFSARVRANLLEVDEANNLTYTFTDATIDGTPFVQEITQKVKLSAEEIAANSLSKLGLSGDQVAAIMAQIRAGAIAGQQ